MDKTEFVSAVVNRVKTMELQGIDIDILLAEIERRKTTKPALINNFSYGPLQEICEVHLDTIGQDTHSDFKDKIYKAAMEMWFGEGVWEYINAICD